MPETEFIVGTIKAAKLVGNGCTPSLIRYHVKQGNIPAEMRYHGKRLTYYIDRAGLMAYAKIHTPAPRKKKEETS